MAADEIMILFLCDHQALVFCLEKVKITGLNRLVGVMAMKILTGDPPHATSYVKLINACMLSDASEEKDVAKQK